MGVNSEVYLPSDVRVEDVADVLGILAGLKPQKKHFKSYGGDGFYVEVEGVEVKICENVPSMVEIILSGDLVDGEQGHCVSYHFECKRGGERMLYPKSTPFWIAVSKKLCKFFGGCIDYHDCDAGGINARWKKPRKKNNPDDGKPWNDLEKAKLALKPVSMKEIRDANKLAGYKTWPELEKKLKEREKQDA